MYKLFIIMGFLDFLSGGLLGAGGSLLSAGINAITGSSAQSKANKANLQMTRETNEANRAIAEATNKANIQMNDANNAMQMQLQREQNVYNSFSQQVARAEEAGINPLVVAGGNNTSNQASIAPTTAGHAEIGNPMQAGQVQPFMPNIDLNALNNADLLREDLFNSVKAKQLANEFNQENNGLLLTRAQIENKLLDLSYKYETDTYNHRVMSAKYAGLNEKQAYKASKYTIKELKARARVANERMDIEIDTMRKNFDILCNHLEQGEIELAMSKLRLDVLPQELANNLAMQVAQIYGQQLQNQLDANLNPLRVQAQKLQNGILANDYEQGQLTTDEKRSLLFKTIMETVEATGTYVPFKNFDEYLKASHMMEKAYKGIPLSKDEQKWNQEHQPAFLYFMNTATSTAGKWTGNLIPLGQLFGK